MVHVAVDDSRSIYMPRPLQPADRDGDIVEQAEAFPMIRKGMVQAAAQMDRDSARQRERPRLAGAAGHQTKPLDERGYPWKLEDADLVLAQAAVPHLIEVFGSMDEREILP
jgi:hypothetical protein